MFNFARNAKRIFSKTTTHNGTLKATIQIDAKGNFHTTDIIDFSSEVYPVVYGSSGNVQYMPSGTKNGACNSCHGSNGNKIWVN